MARKTVDELCLNLNWNDGGGAKEDARNWHCLLFWFRSLSCYFLPRYLYSNVWVACLWCWKYSADCHDVYRLCADLLVHVILQLRFAFIHQPQINIKEQLIKHLHIGVCFRSDVVHVDDESSSNSMFHFWYFKVFLSFWWEFLMNLCCLHYMAEMCSCPVTA